MAFWGIVILGLMGLIRLSHGDEIDGYATFVDHTCSGDPYSTTRNNAANCGFICLDDQDCDFFVSIANTFDCSFYNESQCSLVGEASKTTYMKLEGYIDKGELGCRGSSMYSLSVSGLTLVQQLLTCLANCTDQADCTIVLHDHAGENCLMYTTAGCGFPKNGDTRKFDVIECGSPPDVVNAALITTMPSQAYQDVAEYQCSQDYTSLHDNVTCLHDIGDTTGRWAGNLTCAYDNYFRCGIDCFSELANTSTTITCSPGFEIFVIWANYGWDTTFECGASITNDECVHGASNTDIKSMCDGNATCTISPEAFSTYQCPSAVVKYFQGEYKCVQNLYNDSEICQPHDTCYMINITNGPTSMTFEKEGATLNFSCDPGYEFDDGDDDRDNSISLKCLANGTLESAVPTCSAINCPTLEVPEYGNISTEETQYQVQVNYSCDAGYELNTTENSKECQSNRQWLPDDIIACQIIHCPSLEVPEYGNISTQEAQYQIKVNYSCDLGYELNSTEDSKVCRSDGQWFPHEDVTCQIIHCPSLEVPEYGNISTQETQYKVQVNYSCDDGYELNTTQISKECQSNRQWLPDETIACQIIHCPSLHVPEYGKISTQETQYQVQVNYSCDVGYELNTTENSKECQSNRQWLPDEDVACQIIHCPSLEVPEYGNISTQETQYQIQVNYSCDLGYELNSTENSKVCRSDGQWFPQEDVTCQIIHCPSLEVPEYGKISTQETQYKVQVNYACNDGYELNTTENSKECQSNRQWLPDEAIACQIIHCPSLRVPEYGKISTQETQYQVQVNYSCDFGYELNTTENSKECQSNKQWLPDEDIACQIIHCPSLEVPEHGNITTEETQYKVQVKYSCDAGYELNTTENSKECQSDRQWFPDENISCKIIHCPVLDTPENGMMSENNTEYQTSVSFSCKEGYELVPANAVKVCQSNKQWSSDENIVCKILDCGNNSIEHGTLNATAGTTYGSVAMIACNEGYKIEGESSKTISCTSSGNWSYWSDCLIVDCQDPPEEPDNGSIQTTATTYGSTANYSCQTGYLLQGNSSITCLSDGQWSGGSPVCQLLNRHKELLELQVSVECETFSASQLEELLDSSSVEIEILLKAKINALPEDVRYLAIVTVIGVRCNSPLVFVVAIELGNLLNDTETESQLTPIFREVLSESFSVKDPDGNVIQAEIEDITVGGNQAYECTPGYYVNVENEVCLPCPKHTYQPTGLKELCWPCPSGKVTESEATYGEEDEVCLDGDQTQGADSLIGLGIGIPVFFIILILLVLMVKLWTRSRTEEQLKFHRKRGQWPPKHHVRDNISMGRNYAPFYRKKYHH